MKKQYQIDGRDPSAKGYVCENRLATTVERNAVVKALREFGVRDADDRLVYLYGRLDDIHGWYLFAVAQNEYVILGDCLDALEEPYHKVLTIEEVEKFAKEFGSGENIGTAYEAMTEWGVPLAEESYEIKKCEGSKEPQRTDREKEEKTMGKKVYVCAEERLDSAGKELVKVCEGLEQAREWQRESFLKFKRDHAGILAYQQDNASYHWFDGIYEGKNVWECWYEYEHIGWYITEMELEGA